MKTLQKGLAVAVIQILIVLSVGGKLLYDRATRPRVWVRTASIDPDLPIRGRYLTLNLEVHNAEPVQPPDPKNPGLYSGGYYVDLAVEMGSSAASASSRTLESMCSVRSGSASSSMWTFFRSKAYLTRAAVSVRLATVIITGGVLKPPSAQALAVSRQS